MTTKQVAYKRFEINGDLLTPITIFKRLRGEKKFLLESSFQHETKGKFSYVGVDPYMEIIGRAGMTTAVDCRNGSRREYAVEPLTFIERHLPRLETDIPLSFTGGAVGYVGYDAIRPYLDLGKELADDLEMPDLHLMVYDRIVAYEHRTEKVHLIALNVHGEEEAVLEEKLVDLLEQLEAETVIGGLEPSHLDFKPEMERDRFIAYVEQAKDYIAAGEAEQIVLSQRLVADLACDPFSFYRHLRSDNPSPYMFYIDFFDYLILGSSPESLVQTTARQVVTNPIAGTRPRGKTPREDLALEAELLADEKELKEHEMLVQLSREDLAKVCEPDSIDLPLHMELVKYEHVMHLVSELHGRLRDGASSIDALLACMPAGTVSGSPKERAMQLINELEPQRRGVYAGGIGYIAFNRDINLAIAIRSLVIKDGRAYLQVGAGIVADSIPEREYEETLHKAASLMKR